MTIWQVTFDPLLAPWLIGLFAGFAALIALYGLYRHLRGAWLRLAAVVALAIALFNPSLLQEERERLKSVVALVVDESDSQKLAGRSQQTTKTVDAITRLLGKLKGFEVRKIITRNSTDVDVEASTALFDAARKGLQDVPPDQLAGAIMITDGQVHDVPEDFKSSAPVHALITGRKDDRDRRIAIERAPRFGIVGESQTILFRVDDSNIADAGSIEVRTLVDGDFHSSIFVRAGEAATFTFNVPHGGKTIIEFEAESVDGEITLVNNRAFAVLDGIRENLRVLLVSGEPHAGERTWRNLLKSDASVDLVHFTILRPPEKQDGTPINQLSLIAFPTRELFVEKIDSFDLIIFDRYQLRGVLPVLYFDNIARYVRDGGAVLIAAGPEFADNTSIYRTPIAPVLPATPDGNITEEPFYPTISGAGNKHPVTRKLAEDGTSPPKWSRWFRHIGSTETTGDVIMNGPDDKPLLVLDRPGEGRIAMLLSDHVWLWARGFEGGGPHVPMLRRLAHWLMKEPQLDEEALTTRSKGTDLVVTRQTMQDDPGQLSILSPTGELEKVELKQTGDGLWSATIKAGSPGLYQLANGELRALAHVGPANPREYRGVTSTLEKLQPAVDATSGLIKRVEAGSERITIPRIVPVRMGGPASGRDWMGLRTTEASILKGITSLPLFAGFLGLALLLAMLAAMWTREGR
ncbi:MAG: hypothetical protein GY947_09095 [Rhodobacteraceae bacterium]|nr:hypothetical protein [Paracoccaceae bacterium]